MVKLQLLLRPPADADALCPRLQSLGMHVTGVGRATISAEIDPERFACLFGSTGPECLVDPRAAPALPVPHELADAVTLITVAARHVT
ncbi:MAG: hypothetical protein ACLGI6_05050 [Gammaproteobacteria bacterium]